MTKLQLNFPQRQTIVGMIVPICQLRAIDTLSEVVGLCRVSNDNTSSTEIERPKIHMNARNPAKPKFIPKGKVLPRRFLKTLGVVVIGFINLKIYPFHTSQIWSSHDAASFGFHKLCSAHSLTQVRKYFIAHFVLKKVTFGHIHA